MAPAAPALDADTVGRLRAAIGKLNRRLRPTAAGAAAGLTPTRTSVFFTIVNRGPIRLSELADVEGVNPTMLSRVVGDLADNGLVERHCDPDDRRAAQVTATAQGRRLAERMRRERTDVLSLALSGLAPAEQQLVERALPALEHLAEELKERNA